MLALAAVILGAILGSFLNALLFRFNTGRSVLKGRSRCMRCGHTLAVADLVPLFSYLAQAGTCRYCKARISMQYPLVEAGGALLSLLVYRAHPEPIAFFFWLLIFMTLLFVVVYDIRHKIIPWSASLLLLALAVLYILAGLFFPSLLSVPPLALQDLDIWAGVLLALPLFLLFFVSQGRWMGFGDGLLMLSLGSYLGFTAGLTALCIAFWSGALVGIALLYSKRRFTIQSEVPLAPFLIFGAGAVHFLNVDFFPMLPLLLSALW